VERAADDGEPAGTAGRPILRALAAGGLSNVIAVVVRWFGGTKLGKGGLARAYTAATLAALATLPTRDEWPAIEVEIDLPYDRIGAVKRLLKPGAIVLVEERYGEAVTLRLKVAEPALEELREALAELRLEARTPARADAPRGAELA
jgi:putative IMPACT (imprinted ancient) family translation regulator